MGRIKLIYKNQTNVCRIKGTKNEKINPEAVNMYMKRRPDGFVPFTIDTNGLEFKIQYNFNGYISLKKLTKKPINQHIFYDLMESIINTLSRLGDNNLEYGYVILDIEAIFVNLNTNKVSFLYYPVDGYNNNKYFNAFLQDVVKCIKISKGEDLYYLDTLKNMLSNPLSLTWKSLNKYLESIKSFEINRNILPGQNNEKIERAICSKCGYMNDSYSRFCARCGSAIDSGISQSLNYVYNYTSNEGKKDDSDNKNIFNEDDGSEGATVLLSEPHIIEEEHPVLKRLSKEEEITILKKFFSIGKSHNCDYVIADNNTVSRQHAIINYDKGDYYLTDNNSTNHTYINDQMIEAGIPSKLKDGDKITLSNEELIFNIGTVSKEI